MCVPVLSTVAKGQVTAQNTTGATVLMGPWQLAAGADTLRTTMEMREFVGSNFGATVMRRFAAVRTEEPGAWVAGTQRTTEDVFVEDFTLSTTTNQMWVQTAVKAAIASPGVTDDLAEAYIKLQSCITGSGKLVGTGTFNVTPSSNTSQTTYLPIGNPTPALGLTQLMFAFIVSGMDGTLAYGPGYRTYKSNMQQAAAWTSLANYTSVTVPELKNSTELDMSGMANAMFVQPALHFAGVGAAAQIHVAVAAIY